MQVQWSNSVIHFPPQSFCRGIARFNESSLRGWSSHFMLVLPSPIAHEWRVPRYGIPSGQSCTAPSPTLVSEICRLDLQLLEMQCSRPPTLTLQRASYPRIKHFDIFPPFFRDLSQEPSFCICGWKLVSNQEWIAGFRFLLSS
jgi:hypothetical protein